MEEVSKVLGYDGFFASRLRELMKSSEITQKDLAEKIGITRQAISQYMDGSVQPNVEKLFKLASFFKVSTDFLLGKTDSLSKKLEPTEISNMLGLSENAILKLSNDKHRLSIDGRKGEFSFYFNDFVNIFADVEEIVVDGITYWEHSVYQDILHFLQYKKIKPSSDDPEDTSITLVAFKRESNENGQHGKLKFYKNLYSIDEEELMTVYLIQIQKYLQALKTKLEQENYFEDGGISYRTKNKVIDDQLNEIFEQQEIEMREAEEYFQKQFEKNIEERKSFFINKMITAEEYRNLKSLEDKTIAILPVSEYEKLTPNEMSDYCFLHHHIIIKN